MTDLLKELGLEFTAEDFKEMPWPRNSHQYADRANALLREKLKGAKRVTGFSYDPTMLKTEWQWHTEGASEEDTHTGLLICIEEMKK